MHTSDSDSNNRGLPLSDGYTPSAEEITSTETIDSIVGEILQGIQKEHAVHQGMFAITDHSPEFFRYTQNSDNREALLSYLSEVTLATMRDLHTQFPPGTESIVAQNVLVYYSMFMKDSYYAAMGIAYTFGHRLGKRTNRQDLITLDGRKWQGRIRHPWEKPGEDQKTIDHGLSVITRLETLVGNYPALFLFLRHAKGSQELTDISKLREMLSNDIVSEELIFLIAEFLGFADMLWLQEEGYSSLYQQALLAKNLQGREYTKGDDGLFRPS